MNPTSQAVTTPTSAICASMETLKIAPKISSSPTLAHQNQDSSFETNFLLPIQQEHLAGTSIFFKVGADSDEEVSLPLTPTKKAHFNPKTYMETPAAPGEIQHNLVSPTFERAQQPPSTPVRRNAAREPLFGNLSPIKSSRSRSRSPLGSPVPVRRSKAVRNLFGVSGATDPGFTVQLDRNWGAKDYIPDYTELKKP